MVTIYRRNKRHNTFYDIFYIKGIKQVRLTVVRVPFPYNRFVRVKVLL